MIEGQTAVVNALLGTLLTWGLTAAGAALVFFLPQDHRYHRELLDGSLGFAGGVMIAASFWSLLQPSIAKADDLGYVWVWFPAAVGFLAGGFGIAVAEYYLPEIHTDDFLTLNNPPPPPHIPTPNNPNKNPNNNNNEEEYAPDEKEQKILHHQQQVGLRRIVLLVLAITIHNFPEGLAVGVGFGAVELGTMSLNEARALAWGIGLQNFPEGLAVSLPLYRQGLSPRRAFWYGQLSGMVEPIAGVLGALLIQYANPVLPYALGFAAGAMIYVVVDDLIPEVCASNSTTFYSTWGCMLGFTIMMIMDVALG